MKKILVILVLAVGFMAFNAEKKYTLQLNEQELQAVWYCIEESNAPHKTVKEVQELLGKQLQPQLDTTKKK